MLLKPDSLRNDAEGLKTTPLSASETVPLIKAMPDACQHCERWLMLSVDLRTCALVHSCMYSTEELR